jgi:hypothetical protein
MVGSCTHGWLNDRCDRCEEGGRDPEGMPRSYIPMDVKGDESNSIGAAGPSPQWAHT